ncbi:MAG: molybdopterin oxidoreductase family protein [Burkholderiales bacterium]
MSSEPGSSERHVVRGACPHDCPDACSFLVTVENGRALAIRGAPDHPPTDGALCTKVARYLERTYHPDRLTHPMRRLGRKGEGRFGRIGWDEALDEIAHRFRAIAADDPRAILPYDYCGTMGLVQGSSLGRRFFHRLGASLLDRTICATAGKAGVTYTLGAAIGTDIEAVPDAKLILIWGSNPVVSNLHFWTRVVQARRRGAKVIAIDPWRSQTAAKCDEHVRPLPGTDGALALAMMHVLIRDRLVDRDYVDRYTLGFDALVERVAGYTPARVAAICSVPVDTIEALARDLGTIAPAMIRLNYGLQRHAGGGMAIRTITCLPALVGSWRHPAGGLLLSTGSAYPVDTGALERPDLLERGLAGRPSRTINMNALGDALNRAAGPPIRALYVYDSNPAAVAPDAAQVRRGLARDDLFTVVHDSFATDTADWADLVLPATTQLEHFDLLKSYGHYCLQVNHAAIAPLGESRCNTDVFRALAERMGFVDPCFRQTDHEIARDALLWNHPRLASTSFDTLAERGWARLDLPRPWAPFAQGGFPTESGRCEFFSARAQRDGFDPLPSYTPPRESAASAPELARRYPLALISPPARDFLNSSFANVASLVAGEGAPRIEIHPDDAHPRGIADGGTVRVRNDRGSIVLRAKVTDNARPGVVVAPSVWWNKFSPDRRNVNELTSQALADMGGGATFYDVLVEVGAA